MRKGRWLSEPPSSLAIVRTIYLLRTMLCSSAQKIGNIVPRQLHTHNIALIVCRYTCSCYC